MTTETQGVKPWVARLRPDLSGEPLATAVGERVGVHFTTVYDWCRNGMASARAEHLVRFKSLCREVLGEEPEDEALFAPGRNDNGGVRQDQ